MSILVGPETKIVIQGITGKIGKFIAERMVRNGDSKLVAGVTPGKGGTFVQGVPVFDTMQEAVESTNANCSLVLVPARFVRSAVLEAAENGIYICSIYSEGVPVEETIFFLEYAAYRNMKVIGPNAAGVASPGKANLSEFDNSNLRSGSVGIVSKSGTLTYDVIKWISETEGISTVVCLGGDLVTGLKHEDILPLFEEDPDTKAVVLLGEIGGTDEIRAAHVISKMRKPVIGYIAGMHAPEGKAMGHAGAIQSKYQDTARAKAESLQEAGAHVAKVRGDIPRLLAHVL